MEKISAVVITKNEEAVIEGCLKSLSWVDEIIIIDCGSTDKTIPVAKKYTKKIFYHAWKGFGLQRNFAITKAENDWLLVIDADERVSKKLQREIININPTPDISAYALRRYNIFLGKFMQHGGWNPDYPVRLFKKGLGNFDEKKALHEELIVKGGVKKLNNPLYHLSHRCIESNLSKTREYAITQSLYMYQNNFPKITIFSLLTNMCKHFFNRYIRAQGYKDGMEGFIEALYQAFSQIFIIDSMLWELQRGKSIRQIYQMIEKKIENDTYEK